MTTTTLLQDNNDIETLNQSRVSKKTSTNVPPSSAFLQPLLDPNNDKEDHGDNDDDTIIPTNTSNNGSNAFFHQQEEIDAPGEEEEEESFVRQFAKTKGPPEITFLMILIAIGIGSTIGVVPEVMTDRFARLNHGYMDSDDCSVYNTSNHDGGSNGMDGHDTHDKPEACLLGSADAQEAAATSNLISNILTFFTSSLIGSLSDEYGRRGILIIGLVLSTLPPLMLFLIQLNPTLSPWWYYGVDASTGIINWLAIALSSLSDVLPQQFRAPGIGLLLAGLSFGISLSPILALLLNRNQLCLMSFLVVLGGLVSTLLFFPETLPPHVAEEARRRRQVDADENEDDYSALQTEEEGQEPSQQQQQRRQQQRSRKLWKQIMTVILRPLKEMSILNRNSFFRTVSVLAFFSGMVSSVDQLLGVYYLEERLGFTDKDISILILITGIGGLFAQGVLLKPLNECIGEKLVIAFCFVLGAIDNIMYGVARHKVTIYIAAVLSAMTNMAFPTISAIKANNVDVSEQGRIQGALYSLQALASGIGPTLLRAVQKNILGEKAGPGAMYILAGCLYFVVVGVALAIPKDKANSRHNNRNDRTEYNLMSENDGRNDRNGE